MIEAIQSLKVRCRRGVERNANQRSEAFLENRKEPPARKDTHLQVDGCFHFTSIHANRKLTGEFKRDETITGVIRRLIVQENATKTDLQYNFVYLIK